MQKLTFYNSAGEYITIDYQGPYILQNLIGISDAPVEVLSSRGYQQDGQTAAGDFMLARAISFGVVVKADSMQEAYRLRRELIAFIKPKTDYVVIYENDYITVKFTCRVSIPPSFGSAQESISKYKSSAISLVCDNPYLVDVTETTVPMAVETPEFVFPIVFNPEIILSTLSNRRVIIKNAGDVPAPVRVVFLGGSTNPIITNETTGEFIKVNREILPTDTLEITTEYGNKRVWIIDEEGERTNASNYIDQDSTFFSLAVGENELVYDADSGVDSAQVFVYYSNRYLGV